MASKTSKSPESVVRKIKRKTRRKFNSEEKIRIIPFRTHLTNHFAKEAAVFTEVKRVVRCKNDSCVAPFTGSG